MNKTESMRQFLLRQKGRADSLLFLLSCLALLLFVSNEIVAIQPTVLMIGQVEWAGIQLTSRFCIWIAFLAHFITYGVVSGKPLKYAKEHLIELLICVAWFPHHNVSLLRDLTSILSLETVQVIGTLANIYLVLRHIVKNLATHPFVVTGSAFLFVILTASELLVQLEPQTFHNLFDALWYSMATTTTVGYGDIVPHTYIGRCIGIVLMLSGISLAGAFIGIVSQSLQRRLGQQNEQKELIELREKLAQEQAKNQRLVDALEKDNEIKSKILGLLEKLDSKPESK